VSPDSLRDDVDARLEGDAEGRPPGWSVNPSKWSQRIPIIALALVGAGAAGWLALFQRGTVDTVWEPFFGDGTEQIVRESGFSEFFERFPIGDAGIGLLGYVADAVTGAIGGTRRWRTMPWLVILFGVMIVPLGAVSIFFIVIQPIVIGTWCTLCLIAAAAMLIQIPYSLDELVATGEFLYRRKKQGRPLLRIFFLGDTDDGKWEDVEDDFEQPPTAIFKEMLVGGITLPWNLMLSLPIGLWLMFTRLTLGSEAGMANADHLIGSLVITVVVTALAESARVVRFLIIPLGAALLTTPFIYGADMTAMAASVICGILLILLSFRRGPVINGYGLWNKYIV